MARKTPYPLKQIGQNVLSDMESAFIALERAEMDPELRLLSQWVLAERIAGEYRKAGKEAVANQWRSTARWYQTYYLEYLPPGSPSGAYGE